MPAIFWFFVYLNSIRIEKIKVEKYTLKTQKEKYMDLNFRTLEAHEIDCKATVVENKV